MKNIIILLFVAAIIYAKSEENGAVNYTIVKNDNLWNIAETYYNNPYRWRYIWEHNNYIENPHRIYPDDKLFIPGLSKTSSPAENILYDTAKTFAQISQEIKNTPTKQQLNLAEKFKYYFSLEAQRQAPFIIETGKKNSEKQTGFSDYGEVIDGGKPILIQHKDAKVLLNEDKVAQVKAGERFDFYELRGNLPLREISGLIVEPVASGTVKFVDTDNGYATIFIDKVWGLLSIGARVSPAKTYQSLGDELTYKVLSDSLRASVIARMESDVSLKPGSVFFIDKGTADGVLLGSHFSFYETGKQNYSNESIAEGLVIAAENRTATVRITTAKGYSSSYTFLGVKNGVIVKK